jgi:hypothetical protein
MPELPQEVFPFPFDKGPGRKEVQVPQMREQEKSAYFRRILRQDLQKKLALNEKGVHPF